MKARGTSTAVKAWWAFGGILALGAAYMIIREVPSMRRELRILRM